MTYKYKAVLQELLTLFGKNPNVPVADYKKHIKSKLDTIKSKLKGAEIINCAKFLRKLENVKDEEVLMFLTEEAFCGFKPSDKK